VHKKLAKQAKIDKNAKDDGTVEGNS